MAGKRSRFHGNRMPWVTAAPSLLIRTCGNCISSRGLFRNQQPGGEESREAGRAEKLWDEQAWKNNVYPLYDDLTARVAKQFSRAFGDKKSFTYYLPGPSALPRPFLADQEQVTHHRDHARPKGDDKGVIVALRRCQCGYTLFIATTSYITTQFCERSRYAIVSPVLPKGEGWT